MQEPDQDVSSPHGRGGGGGGHMGGGMHAGGFRPSSPHLGFRSPIISPGYGRYPFYGGRYYGSGYGPGIIPWFGTRRYMLPSVILYAMGRCSMCALPSVVRCPTCGLAYCESHMFFDQHLSGMISTEYCQDGCDCNAVGDEKTTVTTIEIKPSDLACFKCGCHKPKMFRCGRCRSLAYCSKECQCKDWSEWHHTACDSMAKERTEKEAVVKQENKMECKVPV